ncbi:Nucleoside-diphosphate kinase [Sulfobacillus acidophilus TPY]|uniref:Nucleoside diphosphate kinase n=1 Tax=Sulfobacillus acidophilus (strain ATCC 700253 / DSM 10332 / NAL) TaxID=679936 RepID=G8U1D3_SULAD|nr:Nucleoside-diphosphate kinase [Sulfobacillus acidophilus TPY]AEW05453.1 nucleoside diphosphate kinase [Sulfobacillus acidophilus DSM 10332]MCY0865123.1 nucleoside-diphosphate kinase [Sulfobacillus sp.]
MSRTFVMVKPDGVRRGLVGEVIRRFEAKGLTLKAMKLIRVSPELAAQHYAEHREKPFYGELIQFITSGPAVPMVFEGREAVTVARTLMGATDPAKAVPGTIRGDFGLEITENVVHGSDSPESAEREIGLYFQPEELV